MLGMVTDDRIKVLCTRCKSVFRVRLSYVREGYQPECTGCGRLITFDKDSQDLGIQRAFKEARKVRKLIVAEQEQRAKPTLVNSQTWRRRH